MSSSAEFKRGVAHSALLATVGALVNEGERVPCVDPARGYLWLSDESVDQEAAAHGRVGCPALEPCRTYVTQHPEPVAVWAGRIGKREVLPS